MLMLIHPTTGDVATFRKGEGGLAVLAYQNGYRGLSDRTNQLLEKAAARAA